jgi:hypothetical protein
MAKRRNILKVLWKRDGSQSRIDTSDELIDRDPRASVASIMVIRRCRDRLLHGLIGNMMGDVERHRTVRHRQHPTHSVLSLVVHMSVRWITIQRAIAS